MTDAVTIADYFDGRQPPECWPHECSICGVTCHGLDELTDHDHHDWPQAGRWRDRS